MANNRYIFDKRIIKHYIIKYGLMMLLALPIAILVNVLIGDKVGTVAIVFIDIAIFGAVVLICTLICDKIQTLWQERNQIIFCPIVFRVC